MAKHPQNIIEFLSEKYMLSAQPIYNYVYRLIGNAEDSEDIVQESFIEAFEKLRQLKDESKFDFWIKTIARNKALNMLKRDKNRYWSSLDEQSNIPDDDQDPVPWNEFSSDEIVIAINQLPPGFKVVCMLYLIDNLSHEEIAKILDISASTSRSQYSRAKNILRNTLKNSLQHG